MTKIHYQAILLLLIVVPLVMLTPVVYAIAGVMVALSMFKAYQNYKDTKC